MIGKAAGFKWDLSWLRLQAKYTRFNGAESLWQVAMLYGVFWQDEIAASQLETLHFWSKAMPSLANTYSPFEKQLLACPLALTEAEHWP